jgi:hypothetical protein
MEQSFSEHLCLVVYFFSRMVTIVLHLALNINQYLANIDFKKNNILKALAKLDGIEEAYSKNGITVANAQSEQIKYSSKVRNAKNDSEQMAKIILETDVENSRKSIPSVSY